jgi:hypothetical protein
MDVTKPTLGKKVYKGKFKRSGRRNDIYISSWQSLVFSPALPDVFPGIPYNNTGEQ